MYFLLKVITVKFCVMKVWNMWPQFKKEQLEIYKSSGVATGGQGGAASPPPPRKNCQKSGKWGGNRGNQAKKGKIGKKRQKTGRVFTMFTLPLLTDRVGYATGVGGWFVHQMVIAVYISHLTPQYIIMKNIESPFSYSKGWQQNCSTWFVGSGRGLLFLHLVSSNLFLSLHFHRPIGQRAYIGFLAWLEHFVQVWSHQDPSVSPQGATG